jgi:thioredoxin-like negative regulator of GroEL
LWATVASFWLVAALASWYGLSSQIEENAATMDDSFRQAVGEYLKGNWFEAENLLVQLLRRDPDDVDARLKLATLLRHSGRHDEARRALRLLSRTDGTSKWKIEIQHELERLSEPTDDEQTVENSNGVPSPRVSEAA